MSDQIRQISLAGRAEPFGEQLSALMDGELAHDQVRFLLRSIEAESDLARRWSSYHVISATLRREVVLPLRADFSQGILARLDADAVTHVAIGQTALRRYGAMRWVGGGAIAAAVAVVALVVSGPVGEHGAPGGRSTVGSMVAQSATAPAPVARQAYLPLQLPSLTNPNANGGLMQASDETVLENLYAPDGSIVPRDYFSQGSAPYVLYVNPQTHRVDAPLPVQSGAPQK